jgi:hypothetical protein
MVRNGDSGLDDPETAFWETRDYSERMVAHSKTMVEPFPSLVLDRQC